MGCNRATVNNKNPSSFERVVETTAWPH